MLSQTDTGTVSRATLGKPLRDETERYDAILTLHLQSYGFLEGGWRGEGRGWGGGVKLWLAPGWMTKLLLTHRWSDPCLSCRYMFNR